MYYTIQRISFKSFIPYMERTMYTTCIQIFRKFATILKCRYCFHESFHITRGKKPSYLAYKNIHIFVNICRKLYNATKVFIYLKMQNSFFCLIYMWTFFSPTCGDKESSYCFKMQFFHIKFSRRNGAIQFIIAGKIVLLQYDKDDIYKLNFRTERQDIS